MFFSNKKLGLPNRPIESDDGEAFLWEVGSQALAKHDAENKKLGGFWEAKVEILQLMGSKFL